MKKIEVDQMDNQKKRRGLAGAIIAAVIASLCCVGPLVLLLLGVGGAWVGNLTALEPYRPVLMGVTFLFLGYAFYRIYKKPAAEECEPGSYCADPRSDRINKISLWVVTVLIIGLLSIPYITPIIYANQAENDVTGAINASNIEKVTLDVPDMSCPACPFTVSKSLKNLDGIIQADAVLEDKKAYVLYDKSKVSVEEMINATTDAGYPSTVHTKE